MKIAVFGGSGLCGQDLLPVLLAAGHEVRAMRHRTAVPEGCEVVAGSIADPANAGGRLFAPPNAAASA